MDVPGFTSLFFHPSDWMDGWMDSFFKRSKGRMMTIRNFCRISHGKEEGWKKRAESLQSDMMRMMKRCINRQRRDSNEEYGGIERGKIQYKCIPLTGKKWRMNNLFMLKVLITVHEGGGKIEPVTDEPNWMLNVCKSDNYRLPRPEKTKESNFLSVRPFIHSFFLIHICFRKTAKSNRPTFRYEKRKKWNQQRMSLAWNFGLLND